MPTDSILVSIGVCVVFLLFAFAVAWADHSASQWIRDKTDAERVKGPPHRKAV
jgi:hypothetical protein